MKDYDPLADSSPGTADLRAADTDAEDNPGVDDGALILDIGAADGFTACHCGCRAQIASKASFKQGHDQRLVGKLVRAGRAGASVAIYAGDLLHTDAMGAAAYLFPTQAGIDKVGFGIKLATKATPKRAPKVQPVAEAEKVLGFVKIGRWTFPAEKVASGQVTRNEKRDGSGSWIAVDDPSKFIAA